MLAALISCCLYVIGCRVFGEHFPFSNFNLYSDTSRRTHSAVPVFFADGEPANIWEFDRFSGLSADEFLPQEMPTGLTWMVHEAARWVREHPNEESDLGPVKADYGFRVFAVGKDGCIEEEIQILQSGCAWPK
jgi:hypothetical protein